MVVLPDVSRITSIYGKTFTCECGKIHHIDPQRVIYLPDALAWIPDLAAQWTPESSHRAVVLMDERTRAVAGEAAVAVLRERDWQVLEIIVPDAADGSPPICDDRTHAWLLPQMESADIVIPVGSGVLNDLGKWAAFTLGLPYISFGTAASMNGYASANVAATVRGVKTLIRANAPRVVISDPAVIRDAPYEMTASGLGDILAKSVSSADWRLNHLLFGDYFCDRSVSLIADIEPFYFDHPEDVRQRQPAALEALFHGLLLTGVAMTMAETSAPASGGEHLISHTLDMMSALDGQPHDLHGRQVGIGTVLTAELYRRLMAVESLDFSRAERNIEVDRAFWGGMGDEVVSHYTRKVPRLRRAVEVLSQGSRWDRVREDLQRYLRPPTRIRRCLERAGAAFRAEHIGCSRERLLTAFEHAHEIRARFTVIDLARLLGLFPQAANEIIEEWA